MTSSDLPSTGSAYPLAGASAASELRAAANKLASLEQAITAARVVGTAIGILMERRQLTDEQAHAFLTAIAQRDHRPLHDVATDVITQPGWSGRG